MATEFAMLAAPIIKRKVWGNMLWVASVGLWLVFRWYGRVVGLLWRACVMRHCWELDTTAAGMLLLKYLLGRQRQNIRADI